MRLNGCSNYGRKMIYKLTKYLTEQSTLLHLSTSAILLHTVHTKNYAHSLRALFRFITSKFHPYPSGLFHLHWAIIICDDICLLLFTI